MASQRQTQASSASQTPHISPAELSYLYTSLALPNNSPIRPDGRTATQFRPLTAETNILPGTNGSARIGFADGTQAIVGVKVEVERTAESLQDGLSLPLLVSGVSGGSVAAPQARQSQQGQRPGNSAVGDGDDDGGGGGSGGGEDSAAAGQGSWVQMSIEIPGFRDDDALPVFLSEMMREALVGSVMDSNEDAHQSGMEGGLKGRLVINRRWHWRLYIDVLLLSQPLSYPLPLLSLTTHLALLSTKLPKLKSQGEEDPFFDDDWTAAEYLYPRSGPPSSLSSSTTRPPLSQQVRPPITLLVISVADNIIFDPSREEIAVADAVLALSITRGHSETHQGLKLLSIRTIDPPARLTHPGVPNSENLAIPGSRTESPAITPASSSTPIAAAAAQTGSHDFTGDEEIAGVWRPRRGGVSRKIISRMIKMAIEKGGVGEEVLEGLERVEVG